MAETNGHLKRALIHGRAGRREKSPSDPGKASNKMVPTLQLVSDAVLGTLKSAKEIQVYPQVSVSKFVTCPTLPLWLKHGHV